MARKKSILEQIEDEHKDFMSTHTLDNIVMTKPKSSSNINQDSGFFKGGDSNLGIGLLSSTGDFLLDVGQGFFRTLEGLSDTIQYGLSDLSGAFGLEDASDWLKENAKFNSTGSLFGTNENVDETMFGNQWRKDIDTSSYLGGMSDSIGEGLGNIGAMAALGAVGGHALGVAGVGVTETGALTTGGKLLLSGGNSYLSAYGNARSEAYNNGASDDEANKYGIINGFAEALSEQFFDSMPGIKSAGFAEKIGIKDAIANGFSKGLGTNVGKLFLRLVGGLEEGSEEMISNALVAVGQDFMHSLDKNYTYGMDNLTGNVVEDFKKNFLSQDSINSFISAGLTSAILGVGGDILTTAQTNQVLNAFAKDNNMSFKEAKTLLGGQTLNEAQHQVQRESKNGNMEVNNVVELEDAAKKRIVNFMKTHRGDNIESRIEDLVREEEKKQGITFTDEQRTLEANKIRATFVDETNNPDRYTTFTANKNETNNELIESFKKAKVNNTQQAHAMYNFVSKLQENNKNLKYQVVNNEILKEMGQDVEDATINGFNQDGTIYINMDAKNPYQAVAYHEIAHSIKDTSPELYNELKNLVFELKGKQGLEQYRKLYRVSENETKSSLTENVEDEYINDKLGEILNDDKFIQRIENRNILQKIIDEIKRVVKYMISSKDQKALIRTQQKLENIYKQGLSEATGSEGTNYSFSGIRSVNNALKGDISQEDRNGLLTLKQFYNDAKKYRRNHTNEETRQKYGWFKDKAGDWKFEIPDNEASLRINPKANSKYKLGQLLKHDFLYKVEPRLKNLNVEFTDLNRNGKFVKKTNTLLINNNLITESDESVVSTILHEAQHFNQDVNWFTQGTRSGTTYKDMQKYVNNLGEIEAKDVQMRMNLTDEQLEKIAPESSKDNPIHPLRDALLEKRRNQIENNTIDEYNNLEENVENEENYNLPNEVKTQNRGILQRGGIEGNKPSFSLSQDSTGKELSKEQQEYFKDSKVRDAEGRLIPMYHGTPTGTTTEFRPGTYFTSNKQYADTYQNPGASSITSADRKVIDNPRTYQVYLDIKNPFDISNPEIRDIFINEYVKGGYALGINPYLSDEEYNKIQSIDWTEGENLQEFLEEEHPEFDGLVLNEGGIPLGNGEVLDRGTSYVVMSPEQVKNIDNTNPTSNPDIRYSLTLEDRVSGDELLDAQDFIDEVRSVGADVDENGYVTLYHQTSDENAAKIRDSGIMTTAGEDYLYFSTSQDAQQAAGRGGTKLEFKIPAERLILDDLFDDNADVKIALNGNKSLDVSQYLQTNDTRYSLSADGLKNLANELGESYSMLESNLTGRDRAGIKRYLENYTGIVDKYLADNNIQVEPAYRDIEFTRVRTPELQQFVKDNDLTIEKLANDQELQDKYFDLWFGDANEEKFTKQWRDLLDFVKENPREGEIPRPLRAIQREMQQIRDGETQEIDESATKSKKLDAAIDNGYDFWIEEQITPLFEKIDYDADEVMEEAKANHGTTDNYAVGAYMTTDGSLLNFNDGGYRDDHRTISVFNLDMQEFMDYGAMRMKPEGNGFEMAIEPTADQYSRLEDYIDSYLKTNGQEIYVDFDIPGTNNYDSASYNPNTPTSKIINDIKEYYRTGQLPRQSEYADFYYSLSKDNQGQEANSLLKVIESYDDYLKTLPSYQQLQERTRLGNYTDETHGILTKEDYKNKKIDLFNKQIEKADNKMEEQAKRFARENLELTRKAREQLQTIIDKYKGQSRESIFNSTAKDEIREFVRNNSRQEFVEEVIDEQTRDLQRAIRNTELVISKDSAGEFADGITAFKKNNPGLKIKYGKQNIDSVYQELQEQYPGMLEEDVADKDIPFVLADVLKKSYRHFDNSNVHVFELNDKEIDSISNKIYRGLTNNAISDEQLQNMVSEISKKVEEKYARGMASEKYREIARNTIDVTDITDKKRGIQYKINTMKRNLRDIMSKEQAQLWYDTYFKPITIHNAQSEIDKQSYVERIQKYNLNNDESTYTQMLGELKYNPETKLTSEQVNNFAATHRVDVQKCTEAVEEFRNVYDELIERVNESLKANGYKPIDYRKGYFPHFIEDKPNSIIGKFAEKFGWNIQRGTLPTDIAGLTDGFKPGKAWTSFSQKRTGDTTDYNALKGMDNYLRGAMDLIYHTEDIQKLRALENEIRYQYSSEGVQKQIDEIYANQDLSPEEKSQQIALLTDNVRDNPLGNLVTELRDYTNALANKKSILDRGMEQALGRDMFSIMNNINGRVSANMVGANLSSAMTNFIPITQAWSQVSTKNLMRGMYESIRNTFNNDGFDQNSVYLTNRTQQAENLYMSGLDRVNQKLGLLFEGVDSFTSNTIVRAKYYENLENGMSEQAAIENADEFAKDVMAGRSKGDSPTIFNSKNPLYKMFTAFQLEVNNQYGYMFKDLPADLGDEAKDKLAMAFMKMFIGAWLYNMFSEKITGRKAAFSPIDMIQDEYKIATSDLDFSKKVENIASDVAQEAPFIGGIMGGGRLPIQGAIPYENPLSMVLSTAEDLGKAMGDDEGKKKTAINNLKKEWLKPVYYLALPFAGGQIKKVNEGLAMYDKDLPIKGSYTAAGKLRFEADTSPLGMLQAAVFGQYANKNAREYFDKGYTPLSEKQINEALDANLPVTEYREVNKGIAEAKKTAKENGDSQTEAQYDYIYNLPISMEQKNSLINSKLGTSDEVTDDNGYVKYTDGKKTYWYDSENDIVYNNKYKAMPNINIDELTQYSNVKDLSNYGDYGSLAEFNYANENPSKYQTITAITDFDSFMDYRDEITAMKDRYETTSERKSAVFNYINGLSLNKYQKLMLQKMAAGYSIKSYKNEMRNYIESLSLTAEEKQQIDNELFS